MTQSQFIVGMDGGGTKTHAIIATTKGDILSEHIGGPSNFQILGVEKASKTIYGLLRECCSSVKCSVNQIHSVVLGLTGAGRVSDQQRMKQGLKKFAASKKVSLKNIIVESDARIALEGAFNGKAGIILIAGTGSIAFGKDSTGKVHRVGGWGRILGDEGSGYFIGRLGLTSVAHHLDGRGEKTLLTKMVAKKFGLIDQTAIINAVYKNGFDIATVAPLVMEAADRHDHLSLLLVEHAVVHLSEHIHVLAEKISSLSRSKIHSSIPLSLVGGLIANDTIMLRLLKKYVAANIPKVEIIPPMSSPAYGAVVIGMQQ